MAGTTIIGRVGVKIYPDTSDFHREAEALLGREEKRLSAEVDVEIDKRQVVKEARDALRAAQAALRDLKAKIKIDDSALTNLPKGTKIEVDGLDKAANDATRMSEQVKQTRKTLDELKAPELFRQLKNVEVFNPSSVKQYQTRIKQILDAAKAQATLERQRSQELAKALQLAQEQRKIELQKIDAVRAQIDAQRSLAAQKERELANARRLQEEARKAALESEKLARNVERIARASEFDKTLKKSADLLREVNESLEEMGQREKLNLEVEIRGMSKAEREIDQIKRQIDSIRASITPDMDEAAKAKALHKVADLADELQDKLDDLQAQVKPDVEEASYRRAQQRLAWLSRPRTVPLLPKVDNKAAASALAAIGALSGGRLLQNTIRQLRDMFRNIDKNLPLIALMGEAIGTLGAAGLAAASNLFALSASLAQIGPAVLALPGIFGGLAIGLTVTAVALKDIRNQVPEVVEQWSNLKHTIRDNFWGQAREPLRDLANTIMPQLRRGLAAAATEMGSFFGSLSSNLSTELVGSMAGMFQDLAESVKIAEGSTAGLAKIIRILGEQGAGQLPRLAQFFADVTNQFAAFLDEANRSGELQKWINDGIEAIKDLGNVAFQAGRILGGLATAANEAGGAGLQELGDALERIANTVNGPAFQDALIRTLTGAHKAMENISNISGPALEAMFLALADTFERILPVVGATVGEMLAGIAEAIARPELQQGLRDFFDGVNQAVRTLRPALQPIAVALGNLFEIMDVAARTFAPALADALAAIADTFSELSGPIKTVVEELGGAFAGAVKALAPALVSLGRALGPVIEKLGTNLAQILVENTPAIVEFATAMGKFLVDALDTLGPALIKVLDALTPVILALGTDLLQAIIPLLPELAPLVEQLGVALVDALKELAPQIPGLVTALGNLLLKIIPLLPALIPLVEKMLAFALDVLPGLLDALGPIIDNLVTLTTGVTDSNVAMGLLDLALCQIQAVFEGLSGVIEGVAEVVGGFGDTVIGLFQGDAQRISDGFSRIWSGFGKIVEGAFKTVNSALVAGIEYGLDQLGLSVTDFTRAGQDAMQGLIDGITSFMSSLGRAISDAANHLIRTFKNILGIHSPSTVFRGFGENVIRGLINGIGALLGSLGSKVTEAGNRIKNGFNGAASWLVSPGRDVVDGLVNGIQNSFGNISSVVGEIPREIDYAMGYVGNILWSAGQSVIDGFVDGIRSAFWRVQSTLSSLTWMLPDWKGPRETDATILFDAGKLIIQGLVEGLESEYGTVEDSLGKLTSSIANTTIEPPEVKVNRSVFSRSMAENAEDAAAGGAGNGTTVNVHNYNPVAEPASETVNKVMQTVAVLEI